MTNEMKNLNLWCQKLHNASSYAAAIHIVNSFMSYYGLNWYPGNNLSDTSNGQWKEVNHFLNVANEKLNLLMPQ